MPVFQSKKILILIVAIAIFLGFFFAWVKINNIVFFPEVRPVDFTGVWKRSYKNGNKYQEVTYKDGQMNGSLLIFHLNGKTKVKGQYKDRLKIGEWISFDEKGQKIKTAVYIDDVLREVYKDYDAKGFHRKSLHYDADQYLKSEKTYKSGKEITKIDSN